MWLGTIFELRSKKYKIKKIDSNGVYASKMVDEDKCQKGRPSRFSYSDVATALNITVEQLKEVPKPKAPRTKQWAEREEREAQAEKETEKVSEKTPEKPEKPNPDDGLTEEEKKAKAAARVLAVQKLFDLLGDESTDDDW